MNKSPFLLSLLQEYVLCFRMRLAAMLLRREYETNTSLSEFNVLDGEDFIDVSFDVRL